MGVHLPPSNSDVHKKMDVHNPHSNGFPQSTLQMDVHNMDVQKKMDVHNGCPQSTLQMVVHNRHSKWMSTIWMSTIHAPNGCPQSTLQMDVH